MAPQHWSRGASTFLNEDDLRGGQLLFQCGEHTGSITKRIADQPGTCQRPHKSPMRSAINSSSIAASTVGFLARERACAQRIQCGK